MGDTQDASLLGSAKGFFGELLGAAPDLTVDYLRQKYIDVERKSDDNAVPDSVDIRTGQAGVVGASSTGNAVQQSGMNMQKVMVFGGLALAAVVTLKIAKVI